LNPQSCPLSGVFSSILQREWGRERQNWNRERNDLYKVMQESELRFELRQSGSRARTTNEFSALSSGQDTEVTSTSQSPDVGHAQDHCLSLLSTTFPHPTAPPGKGAQGRVTQGPHCLPSGLSAAPGGQADCGRPPALACSISAPTEGPSWKVELAHSRTK
jgi:hypothetical protein